MIIITSIISAIIGSIVTITITTFIWFFRFGRLFASVELMKSRLDRIESNYDNFVITIINQASGKMVHNDSKIENLIKRFDILIDSLIPKGNPISKDDILKLKHYRNKIAFNNRFSIEEYREFEALTRKMESELPANKRDEFDWVIAGLLGVALGLFIAAILANK